jgi:hypothetical protein
VADSSGYQPLEQLNHDLPEREFFEGNQQVAMKLDESTSLLSIPSWPQFPAIYHDYRYIFVTGEHSDNDRTLGSSAQSVVRFNKDPTWGEPLL